MDSLTKALEKLNLSEEYYFGDNLLKEQYFLEDAKKKIEEFFDSTNCSFYYGRKMMTFSVELYTLPNSEFASKLLFNIDAILDVYFTKKNILHEIGWCSSYLLDKRVLNSKEYYEKSNKSLDELSQTVSKTYLIEFSWLNISPNRKMFKRKVQKYELAPFSLCNCFNCKSMLRCL